MPFVPGEEDTWYCLKGDVCAGWNYSIWSNKIHWSLFFLLLMLFCFLVCVASGRYGIEKTIMCRLSVSRSLWMAKWWCLCPPKLTRYSRWGVLDLTERRRRKRKRNIGGMWHRFREKKLLLFSVNGERVVLSVTAISGLRNALRLARSSRLVQALALSTTSPRYVACKINFSFSGAWVYSACLCGFLFVLSVLNAFVDFPITLCHYSSVTLPMSGYHHPSPITDHPLTIIHHHCHHPSSHPPIIHFTTHHPIT